MVQDKTNRTGFVSIFLCPLLILLSTPQLAADDDSENPESEFEIIEVTARKTKENLQRVPLSVSAVHGDRLDEHGMERLSEAQQFSPNTALQTSTATNSTLMAFIRGVGQEDQLWGYESGVGIYIDDVYVARPQGAVLELLDIERLEILRGPQGTLYGKNTIGGAVKYVTRKMSGDYEFSVKGTLGDYQRQDIKVMGQVPVVADKLYVGFAKAILKRDGFGEFIDSDLPSQNSENYNKDVTATRLTLEYHPGTDLFLRLNYDKTADDTNAKGGHRFLPSVLPDSYQVPPVPSNEFDASTSLPSWNRLTLEGLSLTLNYDINENWQIKSVTAKRENYSKANIDFDNTQLRIFDVPAIYDDEQFTQEFQFNYQSEKLDLVSGLYYFDGESCGVFDAIVDVLGNMMMLPGFTIEVSGCSSSESLAAYSQGSYQLTDAFSITLGARYTHEEKDAVVYNGVMFDTLYPASDWVPGFVRDEALVSTTITKVLDDSEYWSRFTPSFGVQYQQNTDIMWYFNYAQGFKSGMFNPRAAIAEPAVEPEVVDSFELGIKSEWFDRLRVNGALFYLEHKDRQFVTVLEGDGPGDLDQRLGNIGQSEAKGGELELSYTMTPSLDLHFTLGHIDSDFTEALAYNGVDYDDISHRFYIIHTPDTTANLAFDYNFETALGQFALNGNYYYRDDYDLIVLDNLQSQSGFGLTNLSLNWFSFDNTWRLGLHVKNLTDKRYLTGGFAFVTRDAATGEYVPGLAGDNILNGYYGEPRTWALSLEYRF